MLKLTIGIRQCFCFALYAYINAYTTLKSFGIPSKIRSKLVEWDGRFCGDQFSIRHRWVLSLW